MSSDKRADCSVYAISVFLESLSMIEKIYPNVRKDLADSAKDLTFEEAFKKNYTLSDSGIAKVIKTRVHNSSHNRGKSSGFRVIYFISKKTNEIVFLNIYSKIGKRSKENVTKTEIKEYLTTLKNEKASNTLLKISLTTFQLK